MGCTGYNSGKDLHGNASSAVSSRTSVSVQSHQNIRKTQIIGVFTVFGSFHL